MDIETTQETTETTGDASRDDLIAAVREAGGTEAVDVAAEEQAVTAEPAEAAPADPAAAAVDPEEPRIASVLRAREKAHAERESARNHAEEMIAKARAESERMIQDAREKADREWKAEMDRRRAAFEASPTEQLRAIGNGDTQSIIDAVLRDGTPEAKAMRELQRELAETKAKAGAVDEVKQQLADMRAEQLREAQAAEVARVRNVFMSEHASAEKAPHLHMRFDADEIFERANTVAVSWRKGGLNIVQPGQEKGENDFDYEDVVKYLESDSKKRLAPHLKSTPAQQVDAGAAVGQPGHAPKVQANGTRTLSAATGSERRTSPKPLAEMSLADQRAALIEEAAAARRANPNTDF